jgi:hypothetical protein
MYRTPIAPDNPDSQENLVPDISLITAAWQEDFYSGKLDDMLDSWPAYKVIVLATLGPINPSERKTRRAAHSSTIIEVDISSCSSHYNEGETNVDSQFLPDHMLYNIGLDSSPTDLVLVTPNGLVFKWGGIFNDDSESESRGRAERKLSRLIIRMAQDSGALPPGPMQTGKPIGHAFIIPVYPLDTDGNPESTKYPQEDAPCGQSNSPRLHVKVKSITSDGEFNTSLPTKMARIKVSPTAFSLKDTIMLPVLFNQEGNHHSRTFVRFPEELSGAGCFGTSIISVLAGGGYSVFWPQKRGSWNRLNLFAIQQPGDLQSTSSAYQPNCGCLKSIDPNSLTGFASKLNKYLERTTQLRSNGISDIHANRPFRDLFMKEQDVLIKKMNNK